MRASLWIVLIIAAILIDASYGVRKSEEKSNTSGKKAAPKSADPPKPETPIPKEEDTNVGEGAVNDNDVIGDDGDEKGTTPTEVENKPTNKTLPAEEKKKPSSKSKGDKPAKIPEKKEIPNPSRPATTQKPVQPVVESDSESGSGEHESQSQEEEQNSNLDIFSMTQNFAQNLGLPSIINSIAKLSSKDAKKIKPKIRELADLFSATNTPFGPIFKGLSYMFENRSKMRQIAGNLASAEINAPNMFTALGKLGSLPRSTLTGILDVINEGGLAGIKVIGSGAKNLGHVADTAFENVKDVADVLMGMKEGTFLEEVLGPFDDFFKMGLNTAHSVIGGGFEAVGNTLNNAAKDGRAEAATARDRRRRWSSRLLSGSLGQEQDVAE